MIRFAVIGSFVMILSLVAVAEDKKEVSKELAQFQGTWKVIEATAGGKPAPKEDIENIQFTFEGEKLIVTERGKSETGSYSVDAKKDPAEIDMVSPKGNKSLGIYKFDKDGKLTMCFAKGEKATRPKAFDDKEAVVVVMEKVKK
jgi:uncharacterized protein (TIGR03067 family)